MLAEVIVYEVEQLILGVKITFTMSPFIKFELVYVAEFVPTLLPLTCHWYVAKVPLFIAFTVKLVACPEQIIKFGKVDNTTEGVTKGFTVIDKGLEIA